MYVTLQRPYQSLVSDCSPIATGINPAIKSHLLYLLLYSLLPQDNLVCETTSAGLLWYHASPHKHPRSTFILCSRPSIFPSLSPILHQPKQQYGCVLPLYLCVARHRFSISSFLHFSFPHFSFPRSWFYHHPSPSAEEVRQPYAHA